MPLLHHIKENHGGFFQYLSASATQIFFKRNHHVLPSKEEESIYSDNSNFVMNRSVSDITISTCTTSESSLFENDDILLPSPSTSTTLTHHANDDYGEEQPWRLNPVMDSIQAQHNYFFQDRDDKQEDNALYDITVERDSYGFKRPTQWVKIKHLHQFDTYYQPILDKQQLKWSSLLFQFGQEENNKQRAWPSIHSPELKKLVRKGIPSGLRGEAWLHYSGAKSKMQANPELYEALVNTAQLMGDHNEYAEIIQRDLHRTFPDNSKFACKHLAYSNGMSMKIETEQNSKLQSLRRILLAFSVHSPLIGYCQSLNYLAGLFLLFVDTEEEAFWMLVTTVHDFLPKNMYDVTMEGANMDQAILMLLISEKLPGIWPHIANGKEGFGKQSLPPATLVTSHWFLTMFINILPIETVLRIWDCFFIEGHSVMFQTALTIIQMNQQKIACLQDPIEIFQILQNMPRRLIDCHKFMDYVFSPSNLFATLDAEEINQKRNFLLNCK